MELPALSEKLQEICRNTGKFILEEQSKVSRQDVESKSLNSLVSYVDKTAEEMLVKALRELLPEAGFITEEDTPDEDAQLKWIIDPVDGTTNYLHGIPVFCISVGLMDGDEIVLGCIYELGQREMFSAWKNGGAFLNGRKIRVNQNRPMKDSLLATGFPYQSFEDVDAILQVLKNLMENSRGVRRLGSAAADLAYVACGRFDGFYETGLSPWDVAAGVIINKEAGGVISDFKGGEDYIFGRQILAATPEVHGDMLEVVKRNLVGSKE